MDNIRAMKASRNLILLSLLCAVMLPCFVQAQFTFTTNNDGSAQPLLPTPDRGGAL